MSSKAAKPTRKEKSTRDRPQEKRAPQARRSRYEQHLSRRRRRRFILLLLAVIGVAIIGLGVIFFRSTGTSTGNSLAGQYAFQVGNPGPGAQAPEFTLSATNGSTFDLAAQQGKTVLLYFQEGLTCQPCWDQLKDIQTHLNQFHALGITSVVSITTDPLAQIKQKVTDEGISIPVLSDSSLAASRAYTANGYGMMGDNRDGHTFVLVGPDGRITWRADYGGSPAYTMNVPVPNLLADIKAGLQGK